MDTHRLAVLTLTVSPHASEGYSCLLLNRNEGYFVVDLSRNIPVFVPRQTIIKPADYFLRWRKTLKEINAMAVYILDANNY